MVKLIQAKLLRADRTITGSNNDLSPVRQQAIIQTNVSLFSTGL